MDREALPQLPPGFAWVVRPNGVGDTFVVISLEAGVDVAMAVPRSERSYRAAVGLHRPSRMARYDMRPERAVRWISGWVRLNAARIAADLTFVSAACTASADNTVGDGDGRSTPRETRERHVEKLELGIPSLPAPLRWSMQPTEGFSEFAWHVVREEREARTLAGVFPRAAGGYTARVGAGRTTRQIRVFFDHGEAVRWVSGWVRSNAGLFGVFHESATTATTPSVKRSLAGEMARPGAHQFTPLGE